MGYTINTITGEVAEDKNVMSTGIQVFYVPYSPVSVQRKERSVKSMDSIDALRKLAHLKLPIIHRSQFEDAISDAFACIESQEKVIKSYKSDLEEMLDIIKEVVNKIEWVQEYIETVGGKHKKDYVDGLEYAMEQLMKLSKGNNSADWFCADGERKEGR